MTAVPGPRSARLAGVAHGQLDPQHAPAGRRLLLNHPGGPRAYYNDVTQTISVIGSRISPRRSIWATRQLIAPTICYG
jgi:hypothetical protein